ncbi:CAAX prenyl protease-related protein [Pseudoduganella sp. CY13W]|uniref:CAAX prenyl protease-related protein n=2 Tax=Duganella qianjiadongensis TaxID=2692176 RepID=A0ABW9VS22_9BURK|nr:CAAX prenyl protease-related protein [Duganella qianjiadongensis]
MVSQAGVARVLPFVIYIAFIAIADGLSRIGMSADALRWLYPVKITAVSIALVVFWKQYQELATIHIRWRSLFLSASAGLLVLWLWITLNADWMIVGHSAGFDPRDDGHINWWLVSVRLFGGAVVVPVMEELFWRSFLMRWIVAQDFKTVVPATINCKSFIVSVILFGIEHNQWLAGIVAGCVYSLLYMRTNKLCLSILAHAVTNGGLGLWILASGQWSYW